MNTQSPTNPGMKLSVALTLALPLLAVFQPSTSLAAITDSFPLNPVSYSAGCSSFIPDQSAGCRDLDYLDYAGRTGTTTGSSSLAWDFKQALLINFSVIDEALAPSLNQEQYWNSLAPSGFSGLHDRSRHFNIGIEHTFRLPDGSSFTPRLELDSVSQNFTSISQPVTDAGTSLANLRFGWQSRNQNREASATVANLLNDSLFLNLTDMNRPGSPVVLEVPTRRFMLNFKVRF